MRLTVLLAFVTMAGCTASRPMPTIEFLTREGCVQTKIMQARLDAAITATGKPMPYTVVNLDTLPKTDVRTGYPTPTILRGGADLFGMSKPVPPYPEPT